MAQGGDATSAGGTAPLPDTPDAIEIAMAAVNSGQPLPDIARTLLEKQAALLDEEARLVKRQAHELDLKIIPERVLAGLWLLLAAAVLGLIGGLAWAVWRAAHTDALVVEPFSMPPALVQQGMTGEVAAGRVIDRIGEMYGRTASVRRATSYERNWGNDLKIDIPNTGLTLEQGWTLLRRSFGRETRVSGDIVETETGLLLSVRLSDGESFQFAGARDQREALIIRAAEAVYRQSQPYRFAIFLRDANRFDEAEAIYRQLIETGSPADRRWARVGLFNQIFWTKGQFAEASRTVNDAIAVDPDFYLPYLNLGTFHELSGHWQDAHSAYVDAAKRFSGDELQPFDARMDRCVTANYASRYTVDIPGAMTLLDCVAAIDPALVNKLGPVSVPAALAQHDAELATKRNQIDNIFKYRPTVRRYRQQVRAVEIAMLSGSAANITAAIAAADGAMADVQADGAVNGSRTLLAANVGGPVLARAHLMLGQLAAAEARLAQSAPDCLPCTLARAALAQARGDMATAARLHDAAVSLAPRLPQPYLERGRFLLAQRKYTAAERNFRAAEKLSNGWADPQKYLGDALAAQGRPADARAAWAEAVRRAPKWAEAQAAFRRAA